MPSLSSLLDPVKSLVAAALAHAHEFLAGLGLQAGPAWLLALVALVLGVRLILLPLVAYGVRAAHAAARAQPHLSDLAQRYKGRTDLESLREMTAEQRAIRAEHGVSTWALAPALVQLPVFFALYAVLAQVADRQEVGAMSAALVGSAASATVLGVGIADRWLPLLGGSPVQGAIVTVLVLAAAALTYVTQRVLVPLNTIPQPDSPMESVLRIMPTISVVGVIIGAAAVPVGLIVYWVVSNAFSLAQQAAIVRWWPSPGTPAYAARAARRLA